MRRTALAAGALALGLAACSAEPDFDERYARQQQELQREAQAIEQELDKRMAEKPGLPEEAASARRK